MNQLAGLITEGQAKKMMQILNEENTTFTLTYNTDQGDLDYIKQLFKKAGINVQSVEAGIVDDEVEITVDVEDLEVAKEALEDAGFSLTNSKTLNKRETTFTLTYNTDPGDLKYVKSMLSKKGILAKVSQGTFEDEVEITVDVEDLEAAKEALEDAGFSLTNSKTLNKRETTFTLTYNTDPGDLKYVKSMLSKKGILAKVSQGTFEDEVEITVDVEDLEAAKEALEDAGFSL